MFENVVSNLCDAVESGYFTLSLFHCLPQTLRPYIFLEARQLTGDGFDSLPEGEIIPFSGVSKSGAGSIIHAGGCGLSVLGASCVELQPALASRNIALKLIDSFLSIGKFLCVFGIESGDITLSTQHIVDGRIGFIKRQNFLISLTFVICRVISIVTNKPG